MLIRTATLEDAPAISALVSMSTCEHIAPSLSNGGLQLLLEGMRPDKVARRIRTGYHFFVAIESDSIADTIIGTAAIRPPSHLYYLFVQTQHQRKGVGRELWKQAYDWISQSFPDELITVNASINAVSAYERLGFVIAAPAEDVFGIKAQPMRWAGPTKTT